MKQRKRKKRRIQGDFGRGVLLPAPAIQLCPQPFLSNDFLLLVSGVSVALVHFFLPTTLEIIPYCCYSSPGVGNGNPLQYSYLGNPMDRGAWHKITSRCHVW